MAGARRAPALVAIDDRLPREQELDVMRLRDLAPRALLLPEP